MKIRKRVLSICLAVMLVVAMAIPASAHYFYDYGDYDGGTYEVSDTCHYFSYSSVMTYDGPAYLLKSNVFAYGTEIVDGVLRYKLVASNYGSASVGIHGCSGETGSLIDYMTCDHYINNVYLYQTKVSAS